MRWLAPFFASSAAALAACSLVVDTSGLVGDAATVGDAAVSDRDAPPVEAGPGDSGGVEAAPPLCDGGVEVSSFKDLPPTGDVDTTAGNVLVATVRTTADGQQSSATVLGELPYVPRSISLAYDVSLSPNPKLYVEFGCALFFEDENGATRVRQLLYANNLQFGQYVNIADQPTRHNALPDLADGARTHHVDLLATLMGTAMQIDVTVDGTLFKNSIALTAVPRAAKVRCGIPYAEQQAPGTTSSVITIKNPLLTYCP